jgi:hypothetical protein
MPDDPSPPEYTPERLEALIAKVSEQMRVLLAQMERSRELTGESRRMIGRVRDDGDRSGLEGDTRNHA